MKVDQPMTGDILIGKGLGRKQSRREGHFISLPGKKEHQFTNLYHILQWSHAKQLTTSERSLFRVTCFTHTQNMSVCHLFPLVPHLQNVMSTDPQHQLAGVQSCRKLLSKERNPPLDSIIEYVGGPLQRKFRSVVPCVKQGLGSVKLTQKGDFICSHKLIVKHRRDVFKCW